MATAREQAAQAGCGLLTVAATAHAGKTSLIMALIDALRDQLNVGVVLGADAEEADAEKFIATGVPAVVAAGEGESAWEAALGQLDFDRLDLAIAEVPLASAAIDLLLVSAAEVLEGETPAEAAQSARAIALNKVDLAPRIGFDRAALEQELAARFPGARIFPTSATTGAGVELLAEWVLAR